jgi:hypothetical protein
MTTLEVGKTFRRAHDKLLEEFSCFVFTGRVDLHLTEYGIDMNLLRALAPTRFRRALQLGEQPTGEGADFLVFVFAGA